MADTGLISTFTNIGQANAIPLTTLQKGEALYNSVETAVSKALSEHTVLIASLLGALGLVVVGGVWYLKKKKEIKI